MKINPIQPRYLNKVLLKGRLGRDPELRFMPSNDPVCNFSLATRSGKHVEWHKIVAYGSLAEYVSVEFGMGDFVYVEAEIRTREFQTADDKVNNRKPRKVLELVADEAHLIGRRVGSDVPDDNNLPAVEGFGNSAAASISVKFSGDESNFSGLPSYI